MHCVATHFIISGQGARVALNSSYGLNFCRHMPGLSHRKLAVPPCKSRRFAVPRTGPVPQVGNFRNTSALLSTHSGLSVCPCLSNMCRLRVHTILYKLVCAQLPEHCKVFTSTNFGHEVLYIHVSGGHESGKTLTHRVLPSCITRLLAERRVWHYRRSCRGRAAAKLLG